MVQFSELSQSVIQNSHKDNHETLTEHEIQEKDYRNTLKTRIHKENVPIQQLYQEEQSKVIEAKKNTDNGLPQFNSIRSGLCKHKAKIIPKIPESIEEIVIERWLG